MPYQSSSERVGADLLLSLTKGKRRKFKPMDSAYLINHQLCHSPIKVTSEEEDREQLWSPSSSSVQGIGQLLHDDGLGSLNLAFREPKLEEVDSFLEDSKPVVDERRNSFQRSEDLEKSVMDKQRIISPSSSNEKPEEDLENRPLQPKKSSWRLPQNAGRHHHAYGPLPPHSHQMHHHAWPQPHHGPPGSHPQATPHYPPHYHPSQYPPWGMYGAPMYYAGHPPVPPRGNHSSQHHPDVPRSSLVPPTNSSMGTDPYAAAKKLDRHNDLDFQAVCPGASRCIPIKHPSATRTRMAERQLPDFSRLVNFADYMARGRHAPDTSGKKKCVMCGKERLSIAARTREDSTHIIPRQNKGVCTACDVAVWLVLDMDTEIKWCKGCKNFRCWAAFGEKGLATKCVRCRQRQKDKYKEKQRLLS